MIDMAQSNNEVKAVIKGWMDKRVSDIHTALPGKIISYDTSTNLAQVQPVGKFKTEDGRELDYPIIHNVPVCFPTSMGGQAGITLPIQPDDMCLLVFQESQSDDFISQSNKSQDFRRHSLNDAVAIPGVYPFTVGGEVSHPDSVCIKCGSAEIWLNDGGFSGSVGGTEFSFSGGDLVVNGISHFHHTHPGCQGGSTGEPQ
jgi:hypothetical protein